MIDFFTLTPEQFEELCFEYASNIYTNDKYALFHTQYKNDGGRDIEINFYDELHRYKIWAECKRHKDNIGLEQISKNVVLVIANRVHKILFFSASSICDSAKQAITKIAYKFNFEVHFLDNDYLKYELYRFPELIAKYFGSDIAVQNNYCSNKVLISCNVSESFENEPGELNNKIENKILLRAGRIFYINVLIKNGTQNYCNEFKIEFINKPDTIAVLDTQGIDIDELTPYNDYLVTFICSITHSDWLVTPLPELLISYKIDTEPFYEEFSLPDLDISKNAFNPFIGKKYIEFMANNIPEIISYTKASIPQIIDIRGKSGAGKSRLADELKILCLKNSMETKYYDCNHYSDLNFVRKLICDTIGIPYNETMTKYDISHIETIVAKYDEGEFFTTDIARFIHRAEYNSENPIMLTQVFQKILFSYCDKKSLLIVLDNIQENSLHFYNILQELISNLSLSGIKLILCLVTNIEYIPEESKVRCERFLDYLDIQAKSKPNQFTLFTCNGFSKEDAEIFWRTSLNRNNYKDELINKLIFHFGDNPLEVITVSDYLKKSHILKQNDIAEWGIVKEQELRKLFEDKFDTYDKIFKKKFDFFIKNLDKETNEAVKKVISAIVIFNNKISLSFFDFIDLDMGIIDLLIEQKILRYREESNSISFYHDSINRYFNFQRQYRNNRAISQRAIDFILEKNIDNAQMLLFYTYYYIDIMEKAKEIGLKLMKDKIKEFHYIEAISIGKLIYASDFFKKDMAYYLECAMLYASALSQNGNKDYSCQVFMELCPVVYHHLDNLTNAKVCRFYHNAVNSQLQSHRFSEAKKVIGYYKNVLDSDLTYRFLFKNREGVVNLSLNNLLEAKKSFDESLCIAETIDDIKEKNFWTSTTYSDMALLHFYNEPTQENREACIKSLTQAINDYEKSFGDTTYRYTEILWHKAFIDILNGQYKEAIKILDQALINKMTNTIYTFYRINNLKSLALIYLREYVKAEEILLAVKSQCEINNYKIGIIRLYNNLGVLYWEMSQKEKSKEYFKLAMSQWPADMISLKSYPVITNNLVIAKFFDTSRLEFIENVIKDKKETRLTNYRVLVKKANSLEQCKGITMWNFQGLDYVF